MSEKKFKQWLKKPKMKLKESPKRGDLIVQVYVERRKLAGGLTTTTKIEKLDVKDYEIQVYPYAYVLKSHEGNEFKEGDVIYLTDNLLLTEVNPEWISWSEKIENSHGIPHDPEPPELIGGLNELELFKFKKDKFSKESEQVDEELYQIPERIVKGLYII